METDVAGSLGGGGDQDEYKAHLAKALLYKVIFASCRLFLFHGSSFSVLPLCTWWKSWIPWANQQHRTTFVGAQCSPILPRVHPRGWVRVPHVSASYKVGGKGAVHRRSWICWWHRAKKKWVVCCICHWRSCKQWFHNRRKPWRSLGMVFKLPSLSKIE